MNQEVVIMFLVIIFNQELHGNFDKKTWSAKAERIGKAKLITTFNTYIYPFAAGDLSYLDVFLFTGTK